MLVNRTKLHARVRDGLWFGTVEMSGGSVYVCELDDTLVYTSSVDVVSGEGIVFTGTARHRFSAPKGNGV